jgi:potassium-transporting ATPase KdpC subunit
MKHLRPAILLTLFFVVVTGVGFPVVVWAIGRVVFPDQAAGSLLRDAKGNVIGSALLGQSFNKPEYFHPRPSAAGSGYDAASSSGTNLGPTSDKLINGLEDESYAGPSHLTVIASSRPSAAAKRSSSPATTPR